MRTSERVIAEYKNLAILKIEDILNTLNIPYVIKCSSMINILCPVHQSEDFSSSSIRLRDGRWTCWSRSCHNDVGAHFINLIGWALAQKGMGSWMDICNLIDNPSFKPVDRPEQIITQSEFDPAKYPTISTPSNYYVGRGFSKDILTKFNIGDCTVGPYADKAIVPIKNSKNKLIGFTARSFWPKCSKCNYHHSPYQLCINDDNKYSHFYKKWIHSKGLKTSVSPYNIENIKTDKVAVIEGPSCVWRLYQFGIDSIACLGKEFTVGHKKALKSIGVSKILFISDNDEAGLLFKQKFIKNNSKDFEIYLPKACVEKDVSEMSELTIKNNILAVWDKI